MWRLSSDLIISWFVEVDFGCLISIHVAPPICETQIIVSRALTILPACSCGVKLFTYNMGIVPICKLNKMPQGIMVLDWIFIPNGGNFCQRFQWFINQNTTYASRCRSIWVQYISVALHCLWYWQSLQVLWHGCVRFKSPTKLLFRVPSIMVYSIGLLPVT